MAEKMDGKTMNITEENLNKLKDLFPEVFEEGSDAEIKIGNC